MNTFAPIAECEDGYVNIWSKKSIETDFTIPTIIMFDNSADSFE